MKVLTDDKKRVRIFAEGIRVDKTLPKYRIMQEEKANGNKGVDELNVDEKSGDIVSISNFNSNPRPAYEDVQALNYETLKKFFIDKQGLKESRITDFNISISDRMRTIVSNTVFYNGSITPRPLPLDGQSAERSFLDKILYFIKDKKRKIKEKREHDTFDVVKFFANVKLASKEGADKYKNRIADYVNCIGMAEKSGQLALKEKLFSELINHKYESILYANGFSALITEKLLVDFCQKAPKALSLDYISNYQRNIPFEVINKKLKIDELEIFDNYVILHYDPNGTSYAKTNEEKKKEVERAKDPILFGVLSGSDKLYYIDSWEDEYCDLTFDKMTEILGKEIVEKQFLQDKIK